MPAIGYGPFGRAGMSPHILAVNIVTRYVGLGPAGVASAERDWGRLSSLSHVAASKQQQDAMETLRVSTAAYQKTARAASAAAEAQIAAAKRVQDAEAREAEMRRVLAERVAAEQIAGIRRVERIQEDTQLKLSRVAQSNTTRRAQIEADGQLAVQRAYEDTDARVAALETRTQEDIRRAATRTTAVRKELLTKEVEAQRLADEERTLSSKKAADEQIAADLRVRDQRRASMQATARAWTSAGMGIGLVSGGIILETAKVAAHFQLLAQHVRANSSISNREFKTMMTWSQRWSAQTGADLGSVMQMYRLATDAGLHFAKAQAYVRESTKLALGTGAEPLDIMSMLMKAQGAYHLRGPAAQTAAYIANQFHVATQMGLGTTAQQMAGVFPRVSGYAGQLEGGRRGMNDALALFAAMTRVLPANQAASAEVQLYRSLVQGSSAQQKAVANLYTNTQGRAGGAINLAPYLSAQGMHRYGLAGVMGAIQRADLTPQEMRALIPTTRGDLAALLMVGASMTGHGHRIPGAAAHSFANISRVLADPRAQQRAGVSTPEQIYTRYAATTTAQMRDLNANLRILEITIGTAFLPQINAILKAVTPLLMRFTEWAKMHPTLIRNVLLLGLALGGVSMAIRVLMMAFGPLTGVIGLMLRMSGFTKAFQALRLAGVGPLRAAWLALNATFIATPIGLIIVGLIALGAILVVAYFKFKPFHDLVNRFAGWAAPRLLTAFDDVRKVLSAFAGWLQKNWLSVATLLFWPFVVPLRLWGHWGPQITAMLQGFLTNISNWIGKNWAALMKNAFNTAFGPIIALWNAMPASWRKFIITTAEAAVSGLASMARKLGTAGEHVARAIINGIKSFWNSHDPVGWIGGKLGNLGKLLFGGAGTAGGAGNVATAGALGSYVLRGASTGFFDNTVAETRAGGNLAMLKSVGAPHRGTITDWDYGTRAGGVPVRLPPGSYKYGGTFSVPGMGKFEWFTTPTGGVIGYNHMQTTLPASMKGKTIAGGTLVGQSGQPTSAQFGSGWHLCIVTDQTGRAYLQWVSTKDFNAIQGKSIGLKAGPVNLAGGGNAPNLSRYAGAIAAASKATGLPSAVIAGEIAAESSGNTGARSWNPYEHAYDIGLMQFGPSEAKLVGGQYTYGASGNIMTGAKYLAYLYNGPAHKNLQLAIAMYNAGPGYSGSASNTYSRRVAGFAQTYSGGGGAGTFSGGAGPMRTQGTGTQGTSAPKTPPGMVIPRTSKPPASTSTVHWVYDRKTNSWVQEVPLVAPDGKIHWMRPEDAIKNAPHYRMHNGRWVKEIVIRDPGGTLHYALPSSQPKPGEIRWTTAGTEEVYHAAGYHHAAGWMIAPGQARYTSGGVKETYQPPGPHRAGGWQIVPGQERYTSTGKLQMYYGPTMRHGVYMAGGWRAAPGTHEAWLQGARRRAQAAGHDITYDQALMSGLSKLYPAHPANLGTMTDAQTKAWLQGREEIAKLRDQISDEQATQKWILGKISTPQYRHLLSINRQVQTQAITTAKQTLQTAQFGGPAVGTYQAYHIFKTEQCVAETQANVHRQQTAINTKNMSQGIDKVHKTLKDIHSAIGRMGKAPTPKAPPSVTHPTHGPHSTPSGNRDDMRYHGHQLPGSAV